MFLSESGWRCSPLYAQPIALRLQTCYNADTRRGIMEKAGIREVKNSLSRYLNYQTFSGVFCSE